MMHAVELENLSNNTGRKKARFEPLMKNLHSLLMPSSGKDYCTIVRMVALKEDDWGKLLSTAAHFRPAPLTSTCGEAQDIGDRLQLQWLRK